MNILRQALQLWRQEKAQKHRGTTLQRRLILFFACVTVAIVLLFAALLLVLGINGRSDGAIYNYLDNELTDISHEVEDDFGRLALRGLDMAENIAASCCDFLEEQGMTAAELRAHPALLEPLLHRQTQTLLSLINNTTCSGVYMMLDATVNPDAENAETAKAGVFIKKTFPVSVQALDSENHFLRGPAQIGRDHGLELLGQWRMEFDISGQDFFTRVMAAARDNPDAALSRLYYWSDRELLKGNSESASLLCVPLRDEDGTVFGLCGIEVSDRMFKSLYSPNNSEYPSVFALAAPSDEELFHAHWGLLAGNHYLTGPYMDADLTMEEDGALTLFSGGETQYSGLLCPLNLYPTGSVFGDETWSFAVMMPREELEQAAMGNSQSLMLLVAVLLAVSLFSSYFISRHYLRPVTRALDSIKNKTYSPAGRGGFLEINDLFEFLAQNDRAQEEAVQSLGQQVEDAHRAHAETRTRMERLSDRRRQEIDPEDFREFLRHMHTLTPKEREIFNLYLAGNSARDILSLVNINENTLKYHNRNIYAKLGVSSRRELLLYAALMERDGGA